MNQRWWWVKSGLPHKQRVIWATSDVLWVVQLTRNIPKNNEQHLLRITPWRSIGELHRWLHYTGQDNKKTRGKDYLVFEDCGETQSVFQKIKMQFQYRRNPNTRDYCWKETSQNRIGGDQGC